MIGERLEGSDSRKKLVTTDAVSVIKSRRSMRTGFSAEEIPDDVVEMIVSCGLVAPSSKNAQPWRLHIVKSREVLQDIAREIVAAKTDYKFVPHHPETGTPRDEFKDTVNESAHVLGRVSVGIFIEDIGNFSISRKAVAETQREAQEGIIFGFGLEYIGLGACIQNMWLAAESQDIRGVFMGDAAIAEDAIRQRLEMTGDFIGVLALGYSDDPPVPIQPKEDRVVWH